MYSKTLWEKVDDLAQDEQFKNTLRKKEDAPFWFIRLNYALFILFYIMLGSILWTYSINEWLEYFSRSPKMEWYHGALLGSYFRETMIPCALLTFVAMAVL